jgi:hypothetical protein
MHKPEVRKPTARKGTTLRKEPEISSGALATGIAAKKPGGRTP